jgi:catechol 2,3-dioxygenase-like lactoylglutathione lyase family enzyme
VADELRLRLADVRLLVEDIERSLAFYRDVVGLPVQLTIPSGVYVEFDTGEATLALYRRDLMEGIAGGGGARGRDQVAVILRAADVDAEVARLRAAGASFETEPHDQEAWGLRVAHLRDPDGNLLELYQPIVHP